ncbi:hypothetical protein EU514_10380 [Pseudomonas fragi]|nr:hypothetical protein [Pseudomonas fragi]
MAPGLSPVGYLAGSVTPPTTTRPVGAGLLAMQTTRSGRHTTAMQSRASPLPQGQKYTPTNVYEIRLIQPEAINNEQAHQLEWRLPCGDHSIQR